MKSTRSLPLAVVVSLSLTAALSSTACGDDDDDLPNNPPGAGSGGTGGSPGSGAGGAGGTLPGAGSGGGGPAGRPNEPGSFDVTMSGEDLAFTGYIFDPATAASNGDPPSFVDGWSVEFEHIVVTVGNIRLNQGPDTNPDDPAQLGAELVKVPNTFAVDVARSGPETDKGSGQPGAWYLTTLRGSFASDTRYALSYDTLPATAQATKVGFDQGSEALYQQAVQNGWAVAFQGRATFVGKATPPLAAPFDAFSKPVEFTLGFANPSSYLNCANPDLGSGGDEPPRGVQTLANQAAVVQVTYHTDHLFWDTLDVEGTPLHFDHIAAQAKFANAGAPGVVTMADLSGVNVNLITIGGTATPLPSRTYVDDYTPAGATFTLSPGTTGITALGDFLEYTAASGGHMNADGECAVKPNFATSSAKRR